ncbi:MAG: PilZ domain-containing protein [Desulfobacteraceae bacterium]|nr:PilZ domain-containing protein [Desulfobacteraceae bacterium]
MAESNNRRYERYDCQLPVQICSEKDPENYYYGLTYNYSKGGMYVKMEAKLNPDNYYLIKMLNYSPESKGPEKHRVIDARVRWSKRAESYAGLEHGYYYGYGFEYSSPVVY